MMKSVSSGVSASDVMSEFPRTMSDIRRLFVPSGFHDAEAHISKIFSGEFCLKTCGIGDIQYAAQKAAEMMTAMRICAIILTVFTVLYGTTDGCAILLFPQEWIFDMELSQRRITNNEIETTWYGNT
uniref:Uncharacterized protein n=1 Tax=Parascaris univalens TaxID=6257 RepID=A0A915BX89_PARUN